MNILKNILTIILICCFFRTKKVTTSCNKTFGFSIKTIIKYNMASPIVLVYYNLSSVYEWIFSLETTLFMINPTGNDFSQMIHSSVKNKNYVFFVENLKMLGNSLHYLDVINKLSSGGKFVIDFNQNISHDEIQETFRVLWSYNIYRSIVHTLNDTLLGWFPYANENDCGKNINLVDFTGGDPFIDRIPESLNGCPINISWNMYAIFMWNPFNDTYPGSIFMAINTIAKIMNFTPIYLTDNSDFLVDFLKMGTFETAEKDMKTRNIDLLIYGSDNGNYVHLTSLQDIVKSVSFFYLKPSIETRKMNIYFNLFRPIILGSIISTFLLITVTWKKVTKQSYFDSIFDVYRLMFQLCIPKLKNDSFSVRMICISFVMLIFFIDIKYNTYLSSVFTSPGIVKRLGSVNQFQTTNPAETEDNAVRRFLYFTGLNNSLGRTSDDQWVLVQHNVTSETLIEDIIGNNSHSSYVHMQKKVYQIKKIEKLQISSEQRLTGIEYKIAARKGFPLSESLNYWIEAIAQTGLIEKWSLDQSVLLRKFIIENPGTLVKTKFRFYHLRGSFYILIVGYLVSSAVFLIELHLYKNGYYRDYLD